MYSIIWYDVIGMTCSRLKDVCNSHDNHRKEEENSQELAVDTEEDQEVDMYGLVEGGGIH